MNDSTEASQRGAGVLPLFLLLILGTIWGLGFSLGKIGTTGGIAPAGYAFWQTAGAGAILLVVASLRGGMPPLTPRHLGYYAISGLSNVAIPTVNMLIVLSVGGVPVGVMALISTLSPLLTYALSIGLAFERFERLRSAGLAIGCGGAFLILLPRSSLPAPDLVPWVVLGMLTPLCYALSNLYIGHRRPPGVSSLALAAAMQLASAVTVLPVALVLGEFHPLWPPFDAAETALLVHMVAAGLASLLLFEVIRMAGPVYLSQVAFVVTATGVLWGMYFFDERHSIWIWGAMALILLGLALVTRPSGARLRTPARSR